jgi:hypothetical protein
MQIAKAIRNKKVWSVWYDGGDEANSFYLTYFQAKSLADVLTDEGYKVEIRDMSEAISERRRRDGTE